MTRQGHCAREKQPPDEARLEDGAGFVILLRYAMIMDISMKSAYLSMRYCTAARERQNRRTRVGTEEVARQAVRHKQQWNKNAEFAI